MVDTLSADSVYMPCDTSIYKTCTNDVASSKKREREREREREKDLYSNLKYFIFHEHYARVYREK